LIAAIAKETGLPLLTSDKHFQEVEGIQITLI
jgi:predicted nucleic acid-binding protein